MDGNGQHRDWSIKKSEKLYQIKGWGEPYFRINEQGQVAVCPDPTRRPQRPAIRPRIVAPGHGGRDSGAPGW